MAITKGSSQVCQVPSCVPHVICRYIFVHRGAPGKRTLALSSSAGSCFPSSCSSRRLPASILTTTHATTTPSQSLS
jgi:hypothetical protein